jgi:uncharacterized protein
MPQIRASFLFVFLSAALAFLAVTAHAAPATPKLSEWVNDEAHVLSQPQIEQLTNFLKDEEVRTSNQVVILTVDLLNGEDIESYANRVFRAAQLGQKGKNNGVLVVAAIKDHRMRIEVGFGLEGALTDALSSQIIRNEIAPEFRNGNYFGGLWAGVHAIDKAIHGEYKGTGTRHVQHAPTIDVGTLLFWMIFFIIILASHIRFRRYRNSWLGPVWIPNPTSGFGSSSFGGSSGGGFFDGGGGGSGFSGGGGSSGGGGASGGW